jgi:hypothetical protein
VLVVDKRYRSSIPPSAKEYVVTAYGREGSPSDRGGCTITRRQTECRYRGKVVGWRFYEEDGTLVREVPLKGDRMHGIVYDWYDSGAMDSAIPYFEGLQHGTARQWLEDGRLMGTYTMIRGTGLDVWRHPRCNDDTTFFVSEIMGWQDGAAHGFQRFLNEDETSVWMERHFQHGVLHGIGRQWNVHGRLRRGYPEYYVRGEQVSKRQYIRAASADPTLPPFRVEDNMPGRVFPAELRRKLGLGKRRKAEPSAGGDRA